MKDVRAIKNMANIVRDHGFRPLIVVVSAMGKTTRALEQVYFDLRSGHSVEAAIVDIAQYHKHIVDGLLQDKAAVTKQFNALIDQLREVDYNSRNPLETYDLIVSFGERLSSLIVSSYLQEMGLPTILFDATRVIKTDSNHTFGKVDWTATEKSIKSEVAPLLKENIVLTQGYIGSDKHNRVVTLGKEGSDFSAAIFATCLKAQEVTIWKDVPGVMNGDPKRLKGVEQIFQLPYKEASEMTYYGASVIHPKTIKPLANHNITLTVRSFDQPELRPTTIGDFDRIDIPTSVIVRDDQCLVSFTIRDLSFVNQKHMARIFSVVDKLNINVQMIQNSAVSISICFSYNPDRITELLSELKDEFEIHYNKGLQLLTIKNYDASSLAKYMPAEDKILLQQGTRDNYRFLIAED